MASSPLISVCINCRNAETTISKTIRSVLDQTYRNIQIIVVDDFSTDNTESILRSFSDDRLEIHRLEKNGHISNANNVALSYAKGEYIAHLDADDFWYNDKLEKQLQFLTSHPEYGACFSLAEMIDENDRIVKDERFRAENFPRHIMFHRMLKHGNYLCHSSLLARKSVMDQVGKHDLTLLYLHDFDYWLRMLEVCDIYILPEKLLRYRISTGSNSSFKLEKHAAHVNEYTQIAYNRIVHCADNFFLTAFADDLRIKGSHTPEQTALEKAFALTHSIPYLPHNPAPAVRRLSELLTDPVYAEIAERDFGFTVHDFYNLNQHMLYHDRTDSQNDKDHIVHQRNIYAALQIEHDETVRSLENVTVSLQDVSNELMRSNAALTQTQQQLADMTAQHDQAVAQYHDAVRCHEEAVRQLTAMASSKSWKLTAPLRALNAWKQINHCARKPRLKDGRPAKAIVLMYGFFAHNFGDDMFFDILFKRYPDTVFVLYDAERYAEFVAGYANVYCYPKSNPRVAKINALGNRLKCDDLFERILLSRVDAVVHIGGSIYQQHEYWKQDLKMRKKRHKRSLPFFSISSSFGPYQTKEYFKFWEKQFKKCTDICFRDTYSSNSYEKVKTVRYVPDLLFAYPLHDIKPVKDRLLISLIDPTFPQRLFPYEPANEYYKTLSALVTMWLEKGKSVCLAAFCNYQGDDSAIRRLLSTVPEHLHKNVTTVCYNETGNFHEVLRAIGECEYMIATRFHAMILGMSAGKKVLPLCYHQKMHMVLDDMKYEERMLDMDVICDMEIRVLYEWITEQQSFDVSKQQKKAREQFIKLDQFIQKKGGAIDTDLIKNP